MLPLQSCSPIYRVLVSPKLASSEGREGRRGGRKRREGGGEKEEEGGWERRGERRDETYTYMYIHADKQK